MSGESFYEAGGGIRDTLQPSARPSIHSHLNCPFANIGNMVSYGLNRDSDDSANEHGVDEVDNVMSKQAYPIGSPSLKCSQKRNSFAAENRLCTEDHDIINALSKSVPAALPSHSYYSDQDQENRSPNRDNYTNRQANSPNRSAQLNSSNRLRDLNSPNRSLNSSRQGVNSSRSRPLNTSYYPSNSNTPEIRSNYTNRSTNTSNYGDLLENSDIENENTSSSNTTLKIVLSLVAILISVYLGTKSFDVSSVSQSNYDESMFLTDVSGLGEKYNVDEDSVLKLQTGISTIVEKQDTGSFIFVYNSNEDNFNQIEFNKFIHEVSFAASKYLRNDSTRTLYTTVEAKRLDMKEHCELITRYRPDLERTGLMLLRHVDEVPSELAMAFHYYCDEYNPLVKKSAIFFTLNLAKCPQPQGGKSLHELIEACLKKKWSSVASDRIGPLLTRVINVVIDVTAAF